MLMLFVETVCGLLANRSVMPHSPWIRVRAAYPLSFQDGSKALAPCMKPDSPSKHPKWVPEDHGSIYAVFGPMGSFASLVPACLRYAEDADITACETSIR
jgi:hypothetical protein